MDEADGYVFYGKPRFHLLQTRGEMDSSCAYIEHSGPDYWKDTIPRRQQNSYWNHRPYSILASDTLACVAHAQKYFILSKTKHTIRLGLYRLAGMGKPVAGHFSFL